MISTSTRATSRPDAVMYAVRRIAKAADRLRRLAITLRGVSPEHGAAIDELAVSLEASEYRLRRAAGLVDYGPPRPHRHALRVAGGVDWRDERLVVVAGLVLREVTRVVALLRSASPGSPRRVAVLVRDAVRTKSPVTMRRRVEDAAHGLLGLNSPGRVMAACTEIGQDVGALRRAAAQTGRSDAGPLAQWLRSNARRRATYSMIVGYACGIWTPVAVKHVVRGGLAVAVSVFTPRGAFVIAGGSASIAVLAWPRRHRVTARAAYAAQWTAQYFTTRNPLITEALTRHTLPWWQGYTRGWNTARVAFIATGGGRAPRGAPVARLRTPRSIAELGQCVINAARQFERLDDSTIVVTGPPVTVSAAGIRLPDLVKFGDRIMARGPRHGAPKDDLGSHIRIIHTRPRGEDVLVVVLPGTQTFATTPVRNPYSMTQNVHLMAFGSASNSRAVREVLAAERARLGHTDASRLRVVLYGHSQGGILAAQLSRNSSFTEQFWVSHVITTGAPVAGGDFPAETSYLVFEHTEDVICKLDFTANPKLANVVTCSRAVVPRATLRRVLDVHRWIDYRSTVALACESDHPTLRRLTAEVGGLLGPIEAVRDYPQERLIVDPLLGT